MAYNKVYATPNSMRIAFQESIKGQVILFSLIVGIPQKLGDFSLGGCLR